MSGPGGAAGGFELGDGDVLGGCVPLEDQCVITRTVTVAAGVFAPGHLGELTQIVPFEMVDQALAATAQARVRVLPSRVVVYLLLAGCLFAELGYRQVWHKLTAGLGALAVASPSDNALWQARARLGAYLPFCWAHKKGSVMVRGANQSPALPRYFRLGP